VSCVKGEKRKKGSKKLVVKSGVARQKAKQMIGGKKGTPQNGWKGSKNAKRG